MAFELFDRAGKRAPVTGSSQGVCVSACKKDPLGGVIGVQSGPL